MTRAIWHQPDEKSAEQAWYAWIKSARLSRLTPLRKMADTIENHIYGLVNASVTGLTNAVLNP